VVKCKCVEVATAYFMHYSDNCLNEVYYCNTNRIMATFRLDRTQIGCHSDSTSGAQNGLPCSLPAALCLRSLLLLPAALSTVLITATRYSAVPRFESPYNILTILSDNYRLPLPVGSLILLTLPTQLTRCSAGN